MMPKRWIWRLLLVLAIGVPLACCMAAQFCDDDDAPGEMSFVQPELLPSTGLSQYALAPLDRSVGWLREDGHSTVPPFIVLGLERHEKSPPVLPALPV